MTTNGTTNGVSHSTVGEIEICLQISERDLCDELTRHPEGRERDEFAISAMKIGAIALRQAQGRIDAERVRQEGDRFIENMGHALTKHQKEVIEQITSSIKIYFDPNSGMFNERVKHLVEKDGELERVIRGQIGGNGSELAQTLTTYVGKESPLMQVLDPESSGGLIAKLTKSTEDTLNGQRERILSEFSLDNKEGALSRLVTDLNNKHGEVGTALKERIDAVTSEFSLDKEDSALSRLVERVERAQRQINSQLSLDEEDSALTRMRKEMLDGIEKQRETNEKFQQQVMTELTAMNSRKKEAERSTRHGPVFEDAVYYFVNERSQRAGDVATHTGNKTGSIKNNKKGDVVIKLSPEHIAQGAQIVVEAKQDTSYTLKRALDDLRDARKNRDAGIGIFVFSRRTAPEGLEQLSRYGNDIALVWDSEDPSSDVIFEAGLSIAKALCVRGGTHISTISADFKTIDDAILEIERNTKDLDDVTKWSETIKSNSDKILKSTGRIKANLSSQISLLNGRVSDLREVVGSEELQSPTT